MTKTSAFGVSKRESHDASRYYDRAIGRLDMLSDDATCLNSEVKDQLFCGSSEDMSVLPTSSVALMVTSPGYHVGKEYDTDDSFEDYLGLLERVFTECYRVLEPGGRAAVNVANLGRKPYVFFSDLIAELMGDIGFLPRGEIVWQKAEGAGGNCAWGTFKNASNPVLRDLHEYILVFSKGRWNRARKGESTITTEEFLRDTLSVWKFPPASAKRIGHPAPFPVELPRRLIQLYTYKDDLVLDPFIGAGTTAVAAKMLGRHYVGWDLHQSYLDIAERRLAEVTP